MRNLGVCVGAPCLLRFGMSCLLLLGAFLCQTSYIVPRWREMNSFGASSVACGTHLCRRCPLARLTHFAAFVCHARVSLGTVNNTQYHELDLYRTFVTSTTPAPSVRSLNLVWVKVESLHSDLLDSNSKIEHARLKVASRSQLAHGKLYGHDPMGHDRVIQRIKAGSYKMGCLLGEVATLMLQSCSGVLVQARLPNSKASFSRLQASATCSSLYRRAPCSSL